MTSSIATTSSAGFDLGDDENTQPAKPEQSSPDQDQLELKTYDPMLNPELDELRVLIANKGIKGESRIREAANKKSFPLALQFEQVDQETGRNRWCDVAPPNSPENRLIPSDRNRRRHDT